MENGNLDEVSERVIDHRLDALKEELEEIDHENEMAETVRAG